MNDQELPVSDLLAARRVADAGPDFWNDLEAQLATELAKRVSATATATTRDVDSEVDAGEAALDELHRWRSRRWLIVTAAAAAIVALVFSINALTEDTAPVITDIIPTTTSTTTTTTTTVLTTTPPPNTGSAEDSGRLALDLSASVDTVTGPIVSDILAAMDGVGVIAVAGRGSSERIEVVWPVDAPQQISPPGTYGGAVIAAGGLWILEYGRSPSGDVGLELVLPRGSEDEVRQPGLVITIPWFEAPIPTPILLSGGDEAVWVVYPDIAESEVRAVRIDAATAEVDGTFDLGSGVWPDRLTSDEASLWLEDDGEVSRLDPESGELVPQDAAFPESEDPDQLVSDDAVWVVEQRSITRFDRETGEQVAVIEAPIGGPELIGANALFSESGALLIEDHLLVRPMTSEALLYRIDTTSNQIDAVLDLGSDSPIPVHMAVYDESLVFVGSRVGVVPLDAVIGSPPQN